jgi:hypothetical protein
MKTLRVVMGVFVAQLGLWTCAEQASEVPVENGVQQVLVCGEKKVHIPLWTRCWTWHQGNR